MLQQHREELRADEHEGTGHSVHDADVHEDRAEGATAERARGRLRRDGAQHGAKMGPKDKLGEMVNHGYDGRLTAQTSDTRGHAQATSASDAQLA
eukprot:5275996-Prymnesium_polylepis.1